MSHPTPSPNATNPGWLLNRAAWFGVDALTGNAALDLAARGWVVATSHGWEVSRKGFAALPANTQEQIRDQWCPTRPEHAGLWVRLGGAA